jgi:hypothetical protein
MLMVMLPWMTPLGLKLRGFFRRLGNRLVVVLERAFTGNSPVPAGGCPTPGFFLQFSDFLRA